MRYQPDQRADKILKVYVTIKYKVDNFVTTRGNSKIPILKFCQPSTHQLKTIEVVE